MKHSKESDFYKTTDLMTCCVLIYFNHTLELINKTNPQRCEFIIKREVNTDNVLENFHKEKLLIEPKRFNSIQRNVKNRLYNN